jgi:hypothetical protein
MTLVTISTKSSTSFSASSLVQVVVNPSPVESKSAQGYRDFKIPRVTLEAFLMLERMISRDQVGSISKSAGA